VGYAGVSGGQEAILAAEDLVRRARYGGSSAWLELDQIIERLPLAVDRVMGEGGLWAPELAARAIRQSQGDPLEAAQLLRAHRSTLPRLGYSEPVGTEDLNETRRIGTIVRTENSAGGELYPELMEERDDRSDDEPFDITRVAARPGAPRSGRLSMLARAETSSMAHLWYATTRKPRWHVPEFPVSLRQGQLPLRFVHPYTGNAVKVAEVDVTEVRTVRGAAVPGEDATKFSSGYGLCFGDNESKALAMAGLDVLVHRDPDTDGLEQQVLMHLDGPDSSGFLEHLKLPHYVDFRSTLERIQAVRDASPAGVR
jgi:alpha-D-ribose 1-methylphosphonate 5-triphosphate synthase subunit PhnI